MFLPLRKSALAAPISRSWPPIKLATAYVVGSFDARNCTTSCWRRATAPSNVYSRPDRSD